MDFVSPDAPAKAGRFFRKLDWSAFWTACLIALGVYFYTLAPTLTLEDSGELATASAHLGVPHPPGYPIWTIITWLFTKLFWFVRYRGQPNPAWSVGLASAVSGALATGFTAVLLCRSGTDMLRGIKRTTEVIGRRTEDIICWVGAVSGSLLFAFSPVNWSQAVINEVYSLNAFFLVVVLFAAYVWLRAPQEGLHVLSLSMAALMIVSLLIMSALTVRLILVFDDFWDVAIHYVLGMLLLWTLTGLMIWVWRKNPAHRTLYLMSLVFGLGLTNYQVLLLLGAALALIVLLKDVHLFRDFVILGAPFVIGIMLAMKGILLPPVVFPTTLTAYVYVLISVGFLVAMYFCLPNGRAVAPAAVCAILGVSVYVFMSLSSETNPPINWGYPRTWEGFQHAITRGQYEKISPTPIFSLSFVRQVGDYLADLRGTFTLPVALLGFLPFTAWNLRVEGRRIRVLWLAIPMAVAIVFLVTLEEIIAPTLGEVAILSGMYRMLFACIMVLAVLGGGVMVWLELKTMARRLFLGKTGPGEVEPWLDTDIDADSRKWTLVTLIAFLAMSVVLISLASPKGDIQDEFIQRVKFISSHALYAFWVGYGLIFGLAFVDTVLKGNRLITWGGIALTALLPILPILVNAYNPHLIRLSGGAEQNGHDFGWQFGNYQLRGAEAIQEELEKDEEPIPNPFFPGEMGPDAIFYGGTDPGRFVPTYMIYCADVRPDVFLITQNALADNTYMQVMRDLYGNQIWIPAQEDSARAFQRYVEEVRSGTRAPNAELKIADGRVQVSGALGVMEINGILAQMIFEYNNYKHDFYVEESYVIPWMYPYLEPHGLIMKINRHPKPLSQEVVRNDQDFWDWYVRRLSENPRFLRDVVARKSFSKLRSAIAGLYARRGRFLEAENAFQQSRILYNLSPEANFRLVQEVLMQQNRFSEAVGLMEEFGRQDPGNDKVPSFVGYLRRIETISKRITELEAVRNQGKMDIVGALELTDCYLQVQRVGEFRAMIAGLLSNTNLPAPVFYRAATMLRSARQNDEMVKALDLCVEKLPENTPADVFLNISRMYAEAQRPDRMLVPLQSFLKQNPNDWRAWLDLAAVQIMAKATNQAAQSLLQARKYGGTEAMAIVESDPRFAPFRTRAAAPGKQLMPIPGIIPSADDRSSRFAP